MQNTNMTKTIRDYYESIDKKELCEKNIEIVVDKLVKEGVVLAAALYNARRVFKQMTGKTAPKTKYFDEARESMKKTRKSDVKKKPEKKKEKEEKLEKKKEPEKKEKLKKEEDDDEFDEEFEDDKKVEEDDDVLDDDDEFDFED